MDILYLLVPLGALIALAIGAAFGLAALGGQFEDLEQAGRDALGDDDGPACGS